jgi:hypothetical protein
LTAINNLDLSIADRASHFIGADNSNSFGKIAVTYATVSPKDCVRIDSTTGKQQVMDKGHV